MYLPSLQMYVCHIHLYVCKYIQMYVFTYVHIYGYTCICTYVLCGVSPSVIHLTERNQPFSASQQLELDSSWEGWAAGLNRLPRDNRGGQRARVGYEQPEYSPYSRHPAGVQLASNLSEHETYHTQGNYHMGSSFGCNDVVGGGMPSPQLSLTPPGFGPDHARWNADTDFRDDVTGESVPPCLFSPPSHALTRFCGVLVRRAEEHGIPKFSRWLG